MIQKLGPQRGAWNEDTVRIIEKVNEIVDLLNGKNEKKTTLDQPKPKEEIGIKQKKIKETPSAEKRTGGRKEEAKQQKRKTDIKKDDQNHNL